MSPDWSPGESLPPHLSREALRGRAAWLGYWRAMRVWHRYSVVGLERVLAPGPMLLVGYHGRPVAHDLCMLQTLVLDQTGALPRAVIHATAAKLPVFGAIVQGMEFVTGDEAGLARAVAEGARIIVTPGGTREGCRSSRDRYRVEWGNRVGYLKLAIRHRLPVVPTAGTGVDDTYLALNDGYAWGKKLDLPGRLPLWLGVGPFGLWPFSVPFPVRITTHVGEPIDVSGVDPEDGAGLLGAHTRVVAAVQRLLDDARAT